MIALPVALLLLVSPQSASRASLPQQLSFGDLNGDGLEDLYVPHSLGGVLFLREADGSLRPAEDGTVPRVPGLAARWRDLEGDGDLDLFVFGADSGHLLRNDGGVLRDATVEAGLVHDGGVVRGLEWLDFDGDGRDDLLLSAERGLVVLRSVGEASFEPFGFGLLGAPPAVVSGGREDVAPRFETNEETAHLLRGTAPQSVVRESADAVPGTNRPRTSTRTPVVAGARGASWSRASGSTGVSGMRPMAPPPNPVITGASPLVGLAGTPGKSLPSGSILLWSSTKAPQGFTLRSETLDPHGPGPSWSVGPSLPSPVLLPYGGTVGGELVVVDDGGTYAFDPRFATWSSRAFDPIGRTGAGTAAIGTLLYCVGGQDRGGKPLDALSIFDSQRDTWTRGAPLPALAAQCAAAAAGGKVYVFGGFNRGGTFGSVVLQNAIYCYDPALDTWTTQGAILSIPRTVGAAAAFNGKIYLFGSGPSSNAGGNLLEVYDPATDTLTSYGASMPGFLLTGTAAVVNGEIHVFGMNSPAGHDIYDPSLNSWRPGFPLLAPESNGVAGVLSDQIGVVSSNGMEFYLYGTIVPPLHLIEKN